jgi:hypothetical protein
MAKGDQESTGTVTVDHATAISAAAPGWLAVGGAVAAAGTATAPVTPPDTAACRSASLIWSRVQVTRSCTGRPSWPRGRKMGQ